MVFVDLPRDELEALVAQLASEQIRIRGPRWVFHLDVSFDDVERLTSALKTG